MVFAVQNGFADIRIQFVCPSFASKVFFRTNPPINVDVLDILSQTNPYTTNHKVLIFFEFCGISFPKSEIVQV